MDIIAEYFKFKKRNILEYCKVLLQKDKLDEQTSKYLNIFIETYINIYYYEIFDTIEEKNYTSVKYKDINAEVKGKYLEAIYELDKKSKTEKEKSEIKKIISRTYTIALLSIIIDIHDYQACELLNDYKMDIKKILTTNSKIVKLNSEELDELAKLIQKSKKITNEYLTKLESPTFFITYDTYRGHNDKYITKMHFNIDRITNNYKKIVIDRVYNSKEVYEEKIIQKLHLINSNLLKKALNREKIDNYFLNLPIEFIDNSEKLSQIFELVSNPISKKHIVFMLNYKYYLNKKLLFKDFKDFNYAILIDLSRIKDINKKIDELESLTLFKYIIIDKVKDEDRRLITSYEFQGKELLQNRYNYSEEDEE